MKVQERQARMLNSLVEGKYSKRMTIQGKDMYKDLDVLRNHRRDLLDQAVTHKESVFFQKVAKKEEELDIISQIKETLTAVASRKKNVLYKQRVSLSNSLND